MMFEIYVIIFSCISLTFLMLSIIFGTEHRFFMKKNRSGCPVEEVFVQLGGRWKMMILSFLLEKPRRFSEIKNNIPNISQRMLILQLNFLENKGFIERNVYEGKPVKVEYSLTEEGQYLDRFILMCREYGEWIRERETMRDSFNHCL